MGHLRAKGRCLVHFTPDTAFHANRSRFFRQTAGQYDALVTTKSFELEQYRELVGNSHVILATQAYDPTLHRPSQTNSLRAPAVSFIGLCEPDREACVDALLSQNVPVRLAGKGWGAFCRKNRNRAELDFLGDGLFGEQYATEYASTSIGLGLLSKRFPELHTTRTFEIPACGALLATERNQETAKFFDDDQVLFFESYEQLARDAQRLLEQPEKLLQRANKGHRRVLSGGFDYPNVLQRVLDELAISD
jgi:spore maturation protein CgeB